MEEEEGDILGRVEALDETGDSGVASMVPARHRWSSQSAAVALQMSNRCALSIEVTGVCADSKVRRVYVLVSSLPAHMHVPMKDQRL